LVVGQSTAAAVVVVVPLIPLRLARLAAPRCTAEAAAEVVLQEGTRLERVAPLKWVALVALVELALREQRERLRAEAAEAHQEAVSPPAQALAARCACG
jgi:hypothetical protein